MRQLRIILFIFAVSFSGAAFVLAYLNAHKPHAKVTPEQRAAHMIVLLDRKGRADGLCSSTAIGPHALLTASHCNEGDDIDDLLNIDLSTRKFHILAISSDGRDHDIYLIDGPAFKNYLNPEQLLNVPQPAPNQRIVMYGDGLGQYPPMLKFGFVDGASDKDDISDIDQYDGALWYMLPVLPGDSGSALYDSTGRVVGLLTYGYDAPSRREPSVRAVGFGLSFSEDVIRTAHVFDPALFN